MNLIDKLKRLPDVSFINGDTLEDTLAQMKQWYEEAYYNETGEKRELDNGDPEKLKLDAVGMMLHQLKEYIDFVGKQNLVKYATGAFLENITASLQVFREEGKPSVATVRFNLSVPRDEVYTIPKGTRCATEDDLFFETEETAEIAPGDLFADVPCVCQSAGEDGNGYTPGEINILTDPLPYIESVQNINESGGGADPEGDDELAERFLLTPSAFNAWGGDLYYTYHTKKSNGNIGDVICLSPEPCITDISFILKDGSLPGDSDIEITQKYMDAVCRREVGDVITVHKPDTVDFAVDFDYYINESEKEGVLAIKDKVEKALEEYVRWQTEKFGRDINPDMLRLLVMGAGAKRIVVREPAFEVLGQNQVAVCSGTNLSYGGMEVD